jgi:hypothetical protein
MSQAIVGRIFWKELRVQRAFWASILGLGAFIQLAPTLLGQAYYRSAIEIHWFQSVNILMACCFAMGSTAIAFAGETENRTKSLFQRLPVRTADLLVGKLGWSLVGTYALLLILALTAACWGDAWAGAVSKNASTAQHFDQRVADFWTSLLVPLPFVVVGLLCSLALREVLTTVAVGGVATALFMGAIGSNNWMVALPVLVVLAVGEAFLVPSWLKDSLPPLGVRLRRFARSQTAPGHSTLSVRSSIPWRRASSSLLWKEWRQAAWLTGTFALAGALLMFLCAMAKSWEWRGAYGAESWRAVQEWQLISVCMTTVPLFFGIAAGRADRRDGAYRLLAHRGVSPSAYWVTKHAVWLGLSIATTAWFVAWERLMAGFKAPGEWDRGSLWAFAHEAAKETFLVDPAGFAASLAILLFATVLLYALGNLLSLAIPSAMTSVVLGLIGWVAIAVVWLLVTEFQIPFWWTILLFPPIFLLTGWLRTRYWLIDRNSLAAWSRVAASLVVPLFVICCAVAVFRVVQIPAASLPLELQSPEQKAVETVPLQQSLFVDAVKSLTGPTPRSTGDPNLRTVADGWEFADAAIRDWVAANKRSLTLALEAARQQRGDFPDFEWAAREHGNLSGEGVIDLMRLLLDSARKLESEDKLEEALQTYVAVLRLGDDLKRSNRLHPIWRNAPRGAALEAMDRWAAHSKQTPELIKRAISQFQQFDEDAPSEVPAILSGWRIERDIFRTDVWRGGNRNEETRSAAETGFVRWGLPWELLRLQRLQDVMFSTALNGMQVVERQLRDRGFVDAELIDFDRRHPPWKWERTTLGPPYDSPSGGDWMMIPTWRVNQAATARMHFLVWAACDYRRVHQKLPATLSDLDPTYFSWVPIDPWTGRNFLWEPNGLPARLDFQTVHLEVNQPFIASGGALGCRIEVNSIRAGAIEPARVIARSGRDMNRHMQPQPLDFPAPGLAIPGVTAPHKSDGTLPARPALKPPGGNSPFKK